MELWDCLDENGNKTGEIMKKYDQAAFDRGLYHLGSDVWIINNENKIFIQKRSPEKKMSPNVWAMTGGSAIAGEDSKHAIIRESKEELNIDIKEEDLKLGTRFKTGNVWIDTYFLRLELDFNNLILQDGEVDEVKWATIEEIDSLVANNNFIKHRWEFVREPLLKELKNKSILY